MSALKNNVADILWRGPGGELEVVAFHAEQAISTLFTVEVEVKTPACGISPTSMIKKDGSVVLKAGPKLSSDKEFCGVITRFSQRRTRHGLIGTASDKIYVYDIEIRPKFWLATKRFTSMVYQKKTCQDIVGEVCGRNGIPFSWKGGAGRKREYTVQYEESDFNFICRLLEDEGLCYFFDKQNVVFCDNPGGHPACSPTASALYCEEVAPLQPFGEKEFIRDFEYQELIGTGNFTVNSYNYETSQSDIRANKSTGKPCFKEFEYYDHTLNYEKTPEGKHYANVNKEAEISDRKVAAGEGTCRSFEAGHTFTLSQHHIGGLNKKWILTSCSISAIQGKYVCRFTAIPGDIPFRPLKKAHRPKVYGVQTAVVTGPPGSKVYLDDLGRCKIQCHWDREGPMNDRSSMWIRVSNGYAGKDYGIQWIPRVGHEVLLTHVNGNPDHPIVIGRVYNDFNTPPLGPPEKWQNIIKTIKDNHIMFDDQDNKELIDVRAERDMNTLVIRNDTQTVGNDRKIHVHHDHFETIGNDMTLQIGHNLTESVGNDYRESVGNNMHSTIGCNLNERIGLNYTQSIGCNQTITIGANLSEVVGCNATVTVGANQMTTIGCAKVENIGLGCIETIGVNKVTSIGIHHREGVGVDRSTQVGNNYTTNVGNTFNMGVSNNYILSVGNTHDTKVKKDCNLQVDKNYEIGVKKDFKMHVKKKGKWIIDKELVVEVGSAKMTLKKSGKIMVEGKKINLKASGKITQKGSKINLN